MKKETLLIIKSDLITSGANMPMVAACKISRLFINKDLIQFFSRLLGEAADNDEKLLILNKLRLLVIQIPREPDPYQFEREADEFRTFFDEIKKEQAFYEPLRWIDASIKYLNFSRSTTAEKREAAMALEVKTWLTSDNVCQLFEISRSSLNRRVAEGLPVHGLGGKALFYRQEVDAWLKNQLVKIEF